MLEQQLIVGTVSASGSSADPWLVVGAVAAAAAAVAGFWVILQRWRYLPRPHWVLLDMEAKPISGSERVFLQPDGNESLEPRWNVRTTFANHGDGLAHDVRLETLLPMGWRRVKGKSWARIEPGGTVWVIWPALSEGGAAKARVKRFASGEGTAFVFDRKMRVRWRQRPNWHLVRKQSFNLNKEQQKVNLLGMGDDSDFPIVGLPRDIPSERP